MRALIAALLIAIPLPTAAQTRGEVPEGREAQTLRNAYDLLLRRDFAAASAAYGVAEQRFAGTQVAALAARGMLIADILREIYSGRSGGDGDVMTRIQRSSLAQRVNALQTTGLMAEAEAAYWLAFIDTGGDPQALATQPGFRHLSTSAWVQAVMDAAQ